AVGDDGQAQRLDAPQRCVFAAICPHVGAQHQHGTLGADEQVGDPVNGVGVGGAVRRGGGGAVAGPPRSGPDGVAPVEEVVHVHVEERRPAVRGAGGGERAVGGGGDIGRVAGGLGGHGHRPHHRDVVELLQAAGAP